MKYKQMLLVFLCTLMPVVHAGLLGRYYCGTNIDPNGIITTDGLTEQFARVDANIDYWDGSRYYQWRPMSACANYYTVEWTGFIRIDRPGEYGFGTISDDGSQIWIDGRLVVDNGEGQWYDWEDNITEYEPAEPNQPVVLQPGYHAITVRFYEGPSYDGIELWWLLPDSGPSDIPYYGTTFHGTAPTYNPATNWMIVPADVLYTPEEFGACAADLNDDGIINYAEFAALSAAWQTSPASGPGDFNGDGAVDVSDLAELLILWLQECPL